MSAKLTRIVAATRTDRGAIDAQVADASDTATHVVDASAVSAPSPDVTVDTRVGVVVLTYNRAPEVTATVERLLVLPERPAIVVVDNGSRDGTPELLRQRFPSVTVVQLTDNPGCAGRNAGVQACSRPYVALCDDDTWWEPGTLRRAADLLDAYPHLALIAGKVLVGSSNRVDPTALEMAASPVPARRPLPGPAILGFMAGASMVRKSAFLAAGGFERRFFIGGEEELLTLDLVSRGWELAYVDDVIVHHYPSTEGRDPAGRRRVVVRNHLWVSWLRRPLRRSIAYTWSVLRRAGRDRAARYGLLEALRGLPWALAHRRVVPAGVEQRIRVLEAAQP